MKKCYIIPHTHWDREWRYPVWKTRKLLGDFMKQLMDILDQNEDYHYFLMDGQVAPIVDYLEIYPEDRDRLMGHIRRGRIGIGPWYTLPDLYPIDGECLLRNLNKGIAVCGEMGRHLQIGYNSFGWGQTAQFPQIYADYGFQTIICAKKVSEERAPFAEFLWEGPDGTRVLTSRLGDFARANFFFHAYIDVRYGLKFLSEEFAYSPRRAGFATHRADCAFRDEDWFLTAPKKGHDWSRLKDGLADSFKATDNTLAPETRLLLSGCDFSTPQPDLTEMIEKARVCYPDIEFLNASIEDYAAALHQTLKPEMPDTSDRETGREGSLPVVYGELRDGPACDCSGNALSVRCYLKQLNRRAQTQIIGNAEPFCAFAEMEGLMDNPTGFLGKAWDYLIETHSHDAINGVTQDKTADDVENKLQQAIELGQVAMDMATEAILKSLNLSAVGDEDSCLVVFNPTPRATRRIIRVSIDTPKENHTWRIALRPLDGMVEPEDTDIIQQVGRDEVSCPVHDLDGRPWPFYADRHDIYADVGTIPAMGYRVFQIEKREQYTPKHHYWLPMRKTYLPDIAVTTDFLENEFLSVQIRPNGSFNLTDKATGKVYTGLNRFEDTGDVGNYWAYYPPYENQTFTTLGAAPRIRVRENGPLVGTISIDYEWKLPAYGTEPCYGIGSSTRAVEEVVLPIETNISLRRGGRWVEVSTTVHNNVRNHRLRVAMPTGIHAETAATSGHFTTDFRSVKPEKDVDGGYWPEMQTLPMQTFVDLSDGEDGLAFLSGDLLEYEAVPDPARTVYLTLFRAVGNMIVTGWECVNRYPEQDGSQLLRSMTFDYAIFPHAGKAGTGATYAAAETFIKKPAAWQISGGRNGTLPPTKEFLSVEHEDLILSAYKKADDGDGYILRVYNPTRRDIISDVVFAREIASACETTMAEQEKKPANWSGNRLRIRAGHGRILTCRLRFS